MEKWTVLIPIREINDDMSFLVFVDWICNWLLEETLQTKSFGLKPFFQNPKPNPSSAESSQVKTMAFYSVLRRASSSVLPLAVRAVGSSRAFHGAAVSTVLTVQKGNLSRDLIRRSFVPFLRFSTETASKRSADQKLIQVLESELQCAEETEPGHDGVSSNLGFSLLFFYP